MDKVKEDIVSCCGVVCSDCKYYPKECEGCPTIKGKVFWTEYTDQLVCEIYNCCINSKKLRHCGLCNKFPCEKFNNNDPSKSDEENNKDYLSQLEQINKLLVDNK